jgi:hypothetical protein
MTTEIAIPPQSLPAELSKADALVAVMQGWHATPTQLKMLVERCCDRLATDREIAERTGRKANWLSYMRRQHDTPFSRLYEAALYDEETAVLLLAYLTHRGAHATLYRAVNGKPVQRAQVIAAQTVIEAATRRHQQREHDPLPSLDT